ncbi:MAG: alkaline phosphatase family protein [Lachnospiraceae bacterium]|nr:alkaline phosphatase family protein [Lachnospiraceae bacterium]
MNPDKKVILIVVDGMRPDAMTSCGEPFTSEMQKKAQYSMACRTVFPSLTLPCHISLFYSVPPERHGTTTNQYAPMVHPMDGLVSVIRNAGARSAMFYGWEQLRDIARPGDMMLTEYRRIGSFPDTDDYFTEQAVRCASDQKVPFIFLYLGETDEVGHKYGWMSPEYLQTVGNAIRNVRKVLEALAPEYDVIVTADHGGHDRSHGTLMEEDMTIPLFCFGEEFCPGAVFQNASILDVAPTIAKIMGLPADEDWEGKALF